MFLRSRPSDAQIEQFISSQSDSNFSYEAVGASVEGSIPLGYNVDHSRILLGHGEQTCHKAEQALRNWKTFEMPWVQLCWPDAPIESGTNVAILINHFGFWSLNASRIVRVIQDSGARERF